MTDTPKTFVFVSAGCVTHITDEHAKETPTVAIVDYDNLENGTCPICWGDLTSEDQDVGTCSHCGFDYNEADDQKAIDLLIKQANEQK